MHTIAQPEDVQMTLARALVVLKDEITVELSRSPRYACPPRLRSPERGLVGIRYSDAVKPSTIGNSSITSVTHYSQPTKAPTAESKRDGKTRVLVGPKAIARMG